MALSHKHLAITAREWDAFMAAFYSVTEEFDLPTSDVEDLQAVLLSMRDDCISEGTAADAQGDRYDGLLLVSLYPSVRATRRCLPDRPLRGPPHRRAARRSARGHPRGRAKA